MSPASATTPTILLTSPAAIIVPSGSASSDDSTKIAPEIIFAALTSAAIFFIIMGCIFRRRERKALTQLFQQHEETNPAPLRDPQPQVMRALSPPISHNTSVGLPRNDNRQVPTSIERGDLVLGLQRALLESHQMRIQQEAAEGTTDTNANNAGWVVPRTVAYPDTTGQYTQEDRSDASILSHDENNSTPPHHGTVSEQEGHETPALASGSSLLPESTQSLGVVSPYTYRVNNFSSGFERDHNNNGIPSEQNDAHHVFPSLESPQLVPSLAHVQLLSNPEELEGFDRDSIVNPSEISFGDSLLPPEYQSAWGGGESR
ncbi:hypothetical protein BJ165DRAFT_1441035 [Panaeolus papilionaceus]|nr:hypothetical protein BJ165DRAFT_1441035 [Panaeolus papilionaceus]